MAEDNWEPRPGEMHPIDQAFYDLAIKERDYERIKVDRLEEANETLIEQIMDAQADLQTALGFLRLDARDRLDLEHPGDHDDFIEDRLAKSLARLHLLLDRLGHPMYNAATHPKVNVASSEGYDD